MELKYPKLSSGIKLMYASWWCSLLGVVLGLVSGLIALVVTESLLIALAASGLELVMYVLQVIGLHKAGKDDKRYKKPFYMLVTELAFTVILLAVLWVESFVLLILLGIIGGLTCAILEPLRLYLFVKYTEDLVQQNGDAGVSGYTKTIRTCFIICYGGILIGSFITGMEILTWLGILLIAIAFFSALALFIFYGVFLHNTNAFFKTLEKPAETTPWDEFNF